MPNRTDQLVVRVPRIEIDALAETARVGGYSLSEYVRILVRRANRGAIRIAPKDTEAAVQAADAA